MSKDGVYRSIYYYEWFTHSKNQETGSVQRDNNFLKIDEFLKGIYNEQQNLKMYKDFMISTSQGEEFIVVDNIENDRICFRIVFSKENALPYVEKEGVLTELGTMISDDQNLAEITHCVFFSKYGILGAEYNASGARATTVSDYMVKLSGTESMPNCIPKLNFDAYSKLINGETFSLFDFTVKANSRAYTDILSNKSIFRAIQDSIPDSDTIEVVLKKRKSKNNGMNGFKLPLTFSEIKKLLTDYRDDIVKFSVSQGKRTDAIDLLSDKFVHRSFLLKTTNRTINKDDMYKEIITIFNEKVQEFCM